MVYIFYIQLDPTRVVDGEYQALFPPAAEDEVKVAWVRVEQAQSQDLAEALNEANPRPGETVMNTHEV